MPGEGFLESGCGIRCLLFIAMVGVLLRGTVEVLA